MSRQREQELARRQALLELEAEVQRLTLAATLEQYENMRMLSWASGAGRIAMRFFAAAPRMRWLLLGTLWRKLIRRKA